MADQVQLDLLKQGVAAWNAWRDANGSTTIDLSDADLSGKHLESIDFSDANLNSANLSNAELNFADLTDANLGNANLTKAQLFNAKLLGTNFFHANLTKANVHETNLVGQMFCTANLTGAAFNNSDLSGANLSGANLSDASFSIANLSNANLNAAIISGTDFCNANLSGADVGNIYWDGSRMRGKYLGIRGIDSCFGNALFKRVVADQDFLDTLEARWRHNWRIVLFRLWGFLDYGRSMLRVAAFGFGVALLYGSIFAHWPELLRYDDSPRTWFTPYYFSIVTFTTLGFGDVKPNSLGGELLASSEVIVGYMTLGLLLAVLAEKIARRS